MSELSFVLDVLHNCRAMLPESDGAHAELGRAIRIVQLESSAAHPAEPPRTEPVNMVLHCPACGLQHIDRPDEKTPANEDTRWNCPPHRSHLCRTEDGGCGHIWRPADVATNGVAAVETKGKADSPIAEPPRTVTGDEPISLDNDPRRQELFGAAITGAMAFGYQGVNPPPEGHWLTPHWQTGRAQAELTEAAVDHARKGAVKGDAPTGFDDRGAIASTGAAQARLDAEIAAAGGLDAWRVKGTVTGDGEGELQVVGYGMPNSRPTELQPMMMLAHEASGQYPSMWVPLVRESDARTAVAQALKGRDAEPGAPPLTDADIYRISDDNGGYRFRTADEEGVQFDKHALLDFARAVLSAFQEQG